MGRLYRQPIAAINKLLVQNQVNRIDNIPISTSYLWINLVIEGDMNPLIADAVLLEDNILNLVTRVEIVAGDSSLRKRLDAETLLKNLLVVTGQYPTVEPPAVTFATAPNHFRMIIPVHFVSTGHATALETLLNAQRLSSLSLEVTLADDTVVATPGGGGTNSIDPTTLTIRGFSRELLGVPKTSAYKLNNEQALTPYVAAAPTTDLVEIAQLKGSEPINALMFRTEIAGANSDVVLGDIEIWGAPLGSNKAIPILKTTWQDIQESMKEEFNLALIYLINGLVPPAGSLPYTPFNLVGFVRYQIDASRAFDKGEMLYPTKYDPQTLVVKALILAAGTIYISQQSIGAAE